jgi:glutaredoxin 3
MDEKVQKLSPRIEAMTQITIYTVPPSTVCSKIANYLDAKGFDYELVTIGSDEEREELTEKSGRMSCPIVYAGDVMIGGAQDVIAAHRSGRLDELVGKPAAA